MVCGGVVWGLNLGEIDLKVLWDVRGQLLKWKFSWVSNGWATVRAGFGAGSARGLGILRCVYHADEQEFRSVQISHSNYWAMVPVAYLRT